MRNAAVLLALVVSDHFLHLFHQLGYLCVVFCFFPSVIKGVVPADGKTTTTFLKGHFMRRVKTSGIM